MIAGRMVGVLLTAVSLAGCQSQPPAHRLNEEEWRAAVLKSLERNDTPVICPASKLLGLTEAEVLKKTGLDRLNPEPGTADKKWFSTDSAHFPRSAYDDGYVWKRCDVLTFEKGRVVRHEVVDRVTAHVSIRPLEP